MYTLVCRVSMTIFAFVALLVWLVVPPALAQEPTALVSPQEAKWVPCGDPLPAGCELAVLHGDPSKGPSDVYVRVTRPYVFPTHWHSTAEHIVGVSGNMLVNIKGGEAVYLTPGTYFYLPSKVVHSARCDAPCVIFIGFDKPVETTMVE